MTGKGRKHYRPEQWVDFVNGNLPTEQMKAMQEHLDSKCKNCSELVRIWRKVKQAARREAAYEAPESTIQHVRAAFGLHAQSRRQKRRFEIPRLVFDSLWQPAVSGVRSASTTPRQVLFRAGEVEIEMRIEPEPLSERVNIAGQVHKVAQQGAEMAEILVHISKGKEVIAETKTNRFGEFQVSFVPDAGLQVWFGVGKGRDLSVPLIGQGVGIFLRN